MRPFAVCGGPCRFKGGGGWTISEAEGNKKANWGAGVVYSGPGEAASCSSCLVSVILS